MSERKRRVVVTGMGINTPIGDDLETFYDNLVAGKSAITTWKFFDSSRVYSKVGGDLSDYDAMAKLKSLTDKLPSEVYKRMHKLVKKAPFATRLSILCAADAYIDAKIDGSIASTAVGVVVGGHNLHNNLLFNNIETFEEEPEYIDSMLSLHGLDTDTASTIGETFGFRGPIYTMGGACASANLALRTGVDEILYHDHDIVFVVGGPLDFAPIDLQAMAILGAITYQSFNDTPEQASRPYDTEREGFVPSHGAGVMVVEELEHALKRGAPIYAEILGVNTASDGCHLPSPSVEGQSRTMGKLLANAGVKPEEVDYINAHATSTPLGDVTEIHSIKKVYGDHAYKLKINATKSMLGHCCWSSPVVETIAALVQLKHNKLHPSINIFKKDPDVDLDVCDGKAVDWEMNTIMKNAFGFGGINCCALYRRYNG